MTPADKERQELFTREILPHAVKLYTQALYYGYTGVDAEDLLQMTFLKAYRGLHTFNDGRINVWLRTIMHNTHVSETRKKTEDLFEKPDQALAELVSTESEWDPQASLVDPAIVAELEALDQLTLQIIVRIGFDGHSYEELANELGLSVTAVKGRLFRFRQRMRRLSPTLGYPALAPEPDPDNDQKLSM